MQRLKRGAQQHTKHWDHTTIIVIQTPATYFQTSEYDRFNNAARIIHSLENIEEHQQSNKYSLHFDAFH